MSKRHLLTPQEVGDLKLVVIRFRDELGKFGFKLKPVDIADIVTTVVTRKVSEKREAESEFETAMREAHQLYGDAKYDTDQDLYAE